MFFLLVISEGGRAIICGIYEKHYREFEVVTDLMLGSPPFTQYLPRILIDAHSFGYKIQILNWDNYSGDSWAGFPIKNELYGSPVLQVFRYDFSQKADDESFFNFMDNHFGPDSLNAESGSGWYSTLSKEQLDELLALLNSIL